MSDDVRSGAGPAPPRPPVLLLPGWSDTARRLRRLRGFLVAAGWPTERVRIVEREGRYGSSVAHAERIAEVAERLLRDTGEARVDVVAHSMGGLAARCWMAAAGCARVRRAVFLATPHRGTWAAYLAWGAGGREMRPGSELLLRLASARPDGVACYTVRTRLDLRIFPPSSACLDGARDRVFRGVSHPGLVRRRSVLEAVRDILLEP